MVHRSGQLEDDFISSGIFSDHQHGLCRATFALGNVCQKCDVSGAQHSWARNVADVEDSLLIWGPGVFTGSAAACDAGDDALSDALGDLCLEYEDIEEDLAPESFCCPITHELMHNPVVACDGCVRLTWPALRSKGIARSALGLGHCIHPYSMSYVN